MWVFPSYFWDHCSTLAAAGLAVIIRHPTIGHGSYRILEIGLAPHRLGWFVFRARPIKRLTMQMNTAQHDLTSPCCSTERPSSAITPATTSSPPVFVVRSHAPLNSEAPLWGNPGFVWRCLGGSTSSTTSIRDADDPYCNCGSSSSSSASLTSQSSHPKDTDHHEEHHCRVAHHERICFPLCHGRFWRR